MEDSYSGASAAATLQQPFHQPLRSQHALPLTDDPSDDFCRVCGFGVSFSNPHAQAMLAVRMPVLAPKGDETVRLPTTCSISASRRAMLCAGQPYVHTLDV